MIILVDSSIFIDWLRKRSDFHQRLVGWLKAGRLIGCGVVRAEVLRGIVNRKQRDRIAEFFRLVPEIPTDESLWMDVSETAWTLDRRGRVLPLSDLVIGCCARRAGATVVSTDPHFRQIPRLKCLSKFPDGVGDAGR